MKLLIDEDICPDKWKVLVKENPFASPFQTIDFYKLFNSLSNSYAQAIATEDNGRITSLVVITFQGERGWKKPFSKRAIIYGGPLILENDTESLSLLIKEINRRIKKKVIFSEVRNFNDYHEFRHVFHNNGWNYQPYLNYRLDCQNLELAWMNLNTNRKRQIKKARKNGVFIKEADSLNEVRAFYQILKNLYRNKIKKPLFDFEFFEGCFNSKICTYLLVHKEDRIIGGILCPILPERAIYEFFICGLDYESKTASPSVMATYAAIEYGYQNGLHYFDFMGAGKPSEEYGVREFKAKFGGELVEYGRFIHIQNQLLYRVGALGLSFLKKLNN